MTNVEQIHVTGRDCIVRRSRRRVKVAAAVDATQPVMRPGPLL